LAVSNRTGMDDREVGRIWDQNADTWTQLARMGCDVYRDYLNTPAFLAMLPDVAGLRGLDIGCGEGHNTRLVAERGAHMIALDISQTFLRHAAVAARDAGSDIACLGANGAELPFRSEAFDFVMATMSFMDMPEQDRAMREAYRVLKPAGFLQFSILHPCFTYGMRKWVYNEDGEKTGVIMGDYYATEQGQVEEWIFGATPPELMARLPRFRVPRFDHTLSWWLNALAETGFVLERIEEPVADKETARACPDVADTRIVPLSIIVRCRKGGAGL